MKQINITFTSDEFRLQGTLHMPHAPLPPVVIGSHGLFSNSNSPKQTSLADACNANGMAFFRFDHRGCGESDGNFKEVTSLKARCNDLISAAKTIQKRQDIGIRMGFFGSSMGGSVSIAAAVNMEIDSWVIFATPVRTRSIMASSENSDHANDIHSPFNKKNLQWDVSDTLAHLHHILIVHGDSDQLVPPSNAHEIYTKAGNPKKLILQKAGDHRMSNETQQKDFIREAACWFKDCFDGKLIA